MQALTKNFIHGNFPIDLELYEQNGGYNAFRKAIDLGPEALIDIVSESKLRGRGGAGFPTAVKWKAMPPLEESSRPRYLAVNLDEMEPGTFKDRFLMERDPHQLIEGLLIASFACKIDIVYIFIRGEYAFVRSCIEKSVAEAASKGYIGENILNTGWNCDVRIHTSAGRYMCGEETGLLNSLEGKRANPRSKPPYPQASGLWGKPTVVQNVETLCCIPHIVLNGPEWFKSIGKAKDSGTKIYGVSGKVNAPGCWELPMGTTLRELIENYAKGLKVGYQFRAALPGGASTCFLTDEEYDVPLEFSSLSEIGKFFGTGTVIVLDDKTCPVFATLNLMKFYSRESCGWCTPCREGIPWIENLLKDIENGRGKKGDLELIKEQAAFIGPNAFCAFAMGAMLPLKSAIEKFEEDFIEHIESGFCKYR